MRYRTPDGADVVARAHSSSDHARFAVGQPVGLRYDPYDPTWIAVDGLPTGSAATGVAAVVLGVVAVLLLVAWVV
ncbi:hypothetical protein GCM10025868_34210 [Angustibacter aerolatus]|uniref:DUF3592 domain-containing protein n=1 Tax=Angustibacter aerolatus TaxID=1162965 RepID=A0ABQ6JKT8_9ACTN|nr:hypothetical protein GCM10025868_34210 [Angustibacter aerolatus]